MAVWSFSTVITLAWWFCWIVWLIRPWWTDENILLPLRSHPIHYKHFPFERQVRTHYYSFSHHDAWVRKRWASGFKTASFYRASLQWLYSLVWVVHQFLSIYCRSLQGICQQSSISLEKQIGDRLQRSCHRIFSGKDNRLEDSEQICFFEVSTRHYELCVSKARTWGQKDLDNWIRIHHQHFQSRIWLKGCPYPWHQSYLQSKPILFCILGRAIGCYWEFKIVLEEDFNWITKRIGRTWKSLAGWISLQELLRV